MTPDDVRDAVALIKKCTHDNEAAHAQEDDLYLRLLRAIADGSCSDPAACAREAIKTQEADFQRWCA